MSDKIDPKKDGITHINVYSRGKTDLGQMLSNFTYSPFECEDGRFNSVEGYWYWLGHKEEAFKTLYGFKAKSFGKMLGEPKYNSKTFKEKIKKALKAKLEWNIVLKEELKKSTLPLIHYYVFNDHVVRPKKFDWIIEEWESLRKELKDE